jgi:hypothetical protein
VNAFTLFKGEFVRSKAYSPFKTSDAPLEKGEWQGEWKFATNFLAKVFLPKEKLLAQT